MKKLIFLLLILGCGSTYEKPSPIIEVSPTVVDRYMKKEYTSVVHIDVGEIEIPIIEHHEAEYYLGKAIKRENGTRDIKYFRCTKEEYFASFAVEKQF